MPKKIFDEEYKKSWKCSICDCKWEETVKHYSEKSKFKKLLCNKHYCQMIQLGKITDKSKSRKHEMPWSCEICGDDHRVSQMTINNDYNGYLLCSKHRSQLRFYNKILTRTKFDKNELTFFKNKVEMKLYDIDKNVSGVVKIDVEDVEKVSKYKWCLLKNGYAYSSFLEDYLHRYLVSYEIVDHINRDRLDNRKLNLREATRGTNAMNKSMLVNNTTGFMGVEWIPKKKRWVSRLSHKGKVLTFSFTDKEDAIKQRLQWEYEYFKEFAPQRHLFEEYGIGEDINV